MDHNDLTFFKSSYSTANCTCVEVARSRSGVLVRDSKLAASPVLSFAVDSWRTFIKDVRDGHIHG